MARKPDLSKRKKALEFIEQYNAEHGRGGITAAAKKYKVHPITVGHWVKEGMPESGGASTAAAPKSSSAPKRRSRKAAAKPAAAAKQTASTTAAAASVDKNSVMSKIEKIQDLESQIAGLQTRVAEIKGEIKAML